MIRKSHGFTLIEVIIAMVLLSFISLFTVEAIQRALKTKTKVQGEIDKNSTVRDALRIMERDINMAFNYHDVYIDLYNQAQDERKKRAEAAANKPKTPPTPGPTPTPTPAPTPTPQPGQPVDPASFAHKTEKVYTQFLGDSESLDFTTLSNVRMMEESAISQQAEVGYKIKSCRRRSNQEQSSKCLWRRVANYLHEDITKDGQETVLLENITEFKLRYLGPGKEEEWASQWYSSEKGDGVTKGKFPWAVEITLAVKDTSAKLKDKELRMTMVAVLRNPNNKKDLPATDANGQPVTSTGQGPVTQ